MKNHFIYSYSGNKRNEVDEIIKNIDFKGIKTIIEPFCGSSSMSYYISTLYPKKFNYILNDNNKKLIEIYNIFKNPKEIEKVNKKMNELIEKFNSFEIDEERKKWYNIITKNDDIVSYIFKNKYCSIRPGLYPTFERIKKIKEFKMEDFPIYNFINNENVSFFNVDSIDILKNYKDDKTNLLLLDPPYINTCNQFYDNYNMNIYEWLYNNNINKFNARIYLILENIWIIKLLFAKNKILKSYDKIYEISKKKTEHIIITK